MIPVLYFHGFASSPRGRKVEALRQILEPEGYDLQAPDLNVPSFAALSFEAMVRRGLEMALGEPPSAVVGSSLGALVALEVVRRGPHVPLVLIAPALGVADRWKTLIPPGEDPVMVFNYASEREEPIHRAFFDEIERIHPDAAAPPVRVTVIMGRQDESVPWERVRGVWERWETSGRLVAGSLFVEIPGGDHTLVEAVETIAREIRVSASPLNGEARFE